MNKYNISPVAYQAAKAIRTCIIMLACFWMLYQMSRVFSPPGGPADETNQTRARHFGFSSPSSEVASDKSATFTLPSIKQVQQMICDKGYKIKVDGMLCGACYNPEHSETQNNWDLAYNNQSARATWPSDELMVKEIR